MSRLTELLADGIVKTATGDIPNIFYDRKQKTPYIYGYHENTYYDDETGTLRGDDGEEYDEDGYPVSVGDIIDNDTARKYHTNGNIGMAGGIGALAGGISGAVAGGKLGAKASGKVIDRLIEHTPRGSSAARKLGLGIAGGAAAAGLISGGAVGGGAIGGTPGYLLARHAIRKDEELDNQLTPEQIEALQQRLIISKQAGYDIYGSMMEKDAFVGAAIGAVKAVAPKILGGVKSLGGLAKAEGNLLKTRATAPGLQKAMNEKGIMGDVSGSSIADATLKRNEAFTKAKPALKNIGLMGGGFAAGNMIGNVGQESKVAGIDVYESMMGKYADVTRNDKARFNNIKNLGAEFDPPKVAPSKKILAKQPIKKVAPKVNLKGMGAVGVGAGLGIAGVAGGLKLKDSFDQNRMLRQAADTLLDGAIRKQAALETMAEARLIAEASDLAVNTLGYSVFA